MVGSNRTSRKLSGSISISLELICGVWNTCKNCEWDHSPKLTWKPLHVRSGPQGKRETSDFETGEGMARLEPAGGQSYEDISLRHMFLNEVAPVQSVGKFTHHSYLDTFDECDAELSRQGICNFLIFGRIAEKYIQSSAFIRPVLDTAWRAPFHSFKLDQRLGDRWLCLGDRWLSKEKYPHALARGCDARHRKVHWLGRRPEPAVSATALPSRPLTLEHNMVVRWTKSGKYCWGEPPYTKAEEAELYRRMDGGPVAFTRLSGWKPPPPPQQSEATPPAMPRRRRAQQKDL